LRQQERWIDVSLKGAPRTFVAFSLGVPQPLEIVCNSGETFIKRDPLIFLANPLDHLFSAITAVGPPKVAIELAESLHRPAELKDAVENITLSEREIEAQISGSGFSALYPPEDLTLRCV
jgi:hypothetical protein